MAQDKNETKYRSLVNNLNVGVYRNTSGPKGKFIEANTAIAKMFGYSSVQEFMKIPVSHLYENPEERILFINELKRNGFLKDKELRLKRKNGEIFIGSLSTIAHYNSRGEIEFTDGVIEDITKRKKAEEALKKAHAELEKRVKDRTVKLQKSNEEIKKSEEKYRTLAEAANDAIFIIGKDLRYRYVNKENAKQFRDKPENIVGASLEQFFSQKQIKKLLVGLNKVFKTGKSIYREEELYFPNKKMWSGTWLSPIKDKKGKTISILCISRDITKRKEAEEKIKHLAYHDNLTGVPNRLFFDKLLTKKLNEAKDNNKSIAVFFLDFDNYKNIKNTLGYDFADKLIVNVTKQLKSMVPSKKLIGKIGDDEYLLYSQIENVLDAENLAQNILDIFSKPWIIDKQQVSITANIGIALFPKDGKDVESLENNADSAMTEAKKEGFNKYKYFNKTMAITKEKAYEQLVLANNLGDAIKNREIVVHYQPIINIKIGEIVGMEALVRWQKPNGELVVPDKFIPLAENTGQIIDIGNIVFDLACKQSKKWKNIGFSNLKLTINLSAKQFSQKNLVEKLYKKQECSKNNIILEITESDIMKNPESAIQTMNQLKEAQYMLSIDDFGTGYSSLSYLKKFPVDFIKIDKSFIDNIIMNRKDQAIVSSTISMAHGLGLLVIAEGVETKQQYTFLSQLGCDEVQGYLFAKPIPANVFEELLRKEKRWAA